MPQSHAQRRYHNVNMMSHSERMLRVHRRNQLQANFLNKSVDELDRKFKRNIFQLSHDIRDIYLYEQLPREKEILETHVGQDYDDLDIGELTRFTDRYFSKPYLVPNGQMLKLPQVNKGKVQSLDHDPAKSPVKTKFKSLVDYEKLHASPILRRVFSRQQAPPRELRQAHPLVAKAARRQLTEVCRTQDFKPAIQDFCTRTDAYIRKQKQNPQLYKLPVIPENTEPFLEEQTDAV